MGVSADERLGRRAFEERIAKQAARGRNRHKLFLDKRSKSLSVDRMSKAPIERLRDIADQERASEGKTVKGWAVVPAVVAARNGRTVLPDKTPSNPYHAEIILPLPDGDEEDERTQHAHELAMDAEWVPRP